MARKSRNFSSTLSRNPLFMQIYIINLERAPDRLKSITEEFAKYGLSFERIDAYDGKQHSSSETQSFRQKVEERHYWLMEMTDGEVACYLSHQRAWKALLDSGDEWAFIAEDDIRFEDDPRKFLKDLSWIPDDAALIQLAYEFPKRHVKYQGSIKQLIDGYVLSCLMDYRQSGGGGQGYLINRSLVAQLLRAFPLVNAPVDDLLFFHASRVRKMTRPLFLCPGLISNNDGGKSFLQGEKEKVRSQASRYPLRYIERKLIKWTHALKCRFVYKDMIR